MKTIYKYQISAIEKNFRFKIPQGYQILNVQEQGNILSLWALQDTEQPLIDVHFRLYVTGGEIDEPLEQLAYIGTVQLDEGSFVAHLFEYKGV